MAISPEREHLMKENHDFEVVRASFSEISSTVAVYTSASAQKIKVKPTVSEEIRVPRYFDSTEGSDSPPLAA